MLTEDEFNALLSIVQRAPLTPLEAMGLNPILGKIAPKPAAPVPEPAPAPEPPAPAPAP